MPRPRNSDSPTYLHSLVTFDMESEKVSEELVPPWVPILGQSIAFLDVGEEGILVVIGGQTENEGDVQFVKRKTSIESIHELTRPLLIQCTYTTLRPTLGSTKQQPVEMEGPMSSGSQPQH